MKKVAPAGTFEFPFQVGFFGARTLRGHQDQLRGENPERTPEADAFGGGADGAAPGSAGDNQRQFATNTAANAVFFVFSLLVSVWYTPYMIRHLGTAVYGLVPLANSVIIYLSLIAVALSGGVVRALSVDLAKGDYEQAIKTFSSILSGSALVCGMLLVVATVVVPFSPSFFHLPPGSEWDFQTVFFAIILVFVINTMGSAFGASLWAFNRFEIRSAIDAASLVGRVAPIVILFALDRPRLLHVAIGLVLGGVIGFAGNYVFFRRLTPQIVFRVSQVERNVFRSLFDTSGWLFVNQIGMLLFLNADLILVNILLGPSATGRYAPLVQCVAMLRSFYMMISGLLSPSIISWYARGEHERIARLSAEAMRLLGLLSAIPLGIMCGLGGPIFRIWLGPAFADVSLLAWAVLFPFCIEVPHMPLFSIVLASNRLRFPALATLLSGIGNVVLAAGLVKYGKLDAYGVALAVGLTCLVRNGLIMPLYCAEVLDKPWHYFFRRVLHSVVDCLIVCGIAVCGSAVLRKDDWLHLGGIALVVALSALTVLWAVRMTREERSRILGLITSSGVLRWYRQLHFL